MDKLFMSLAVPDFTLPWQLRPPALQLAYLHQDHNLFQLHWSRSQTVSYGLAP
jgi:hypothetical protein